MTPQNSSRLPRTPKDSPLLSMTFLTLTIFKFFKQSSIFQLRLFLSIQKSGSTFVKAVLGLHVEMNQGLVYRDESDEEVTDKEDVENSDDEEEEDA